MFIRIVVTSLPSTEKAIDKPLLHHHSHSRVKTFRIQVQQEELAALLFSRTEISVSFVTSKALDCVRCVVRVSALQWIKCLCGMLSRRTETCIFTKQFYN